MKKKSNPWRRMGHRAVHMAARFSIHLSRAFSLRTWLYMGKFLGRLIYFLDFHHRRISMRNLCFAFNGKKDRREMRSIVRKNFEQFGMIGNEWIRLRNTDTGMIRKLVQVEGKRHLDAARQKNRSVILLGAHFGNWEYAHAYYSSTINKLNFIVRPIDNPLLEQERLKNNDPFGIRILYKENGLRQAIRNLKRGEDLVIFADRKETYKQVIPCRFFDKKTATMTLVPALARKYRIPVVPMFIVRSKDLIHHRLIFLPELPVDYDKDKEECINEATQHQSDIIEKMIESYPDHWIWLHKRWKKYHPYLYPEDMARRARRKARRTDHLNRMKRSGNVNP
jgi:KDO2-lipid IV(A) lauroyltransferase